MAGNELPPPSFNLPPPTLPGEPAPAKNPRRWPIFAAAGVALLIGIGFVSKNRSDDSTGSDDAGGGIFVDDASSSTHRVRYTVSGTAASGDLTYETPTGTSQDSGVALPTSRTYEMSSGDFVYMSIQNDSDAGKVSCSIEVDGVVISKNSSSGAYVIASCDGSVP